MTPATGPSDHVYMQAPGGGDLPLLGGDWSAPGDAAAAGGDVVHLAARSVGGAGPTELLLLHAASVAVHLISCTDRQTDRSSGQKR